MFVGNNTNKYSNGIIISKHCYLYTIQNLNTGIVSLIQINNISKDILYY